MPSSFTYRYEAPAKSHDGGYYVRVYRKDTSQYLDPTDPTGTKWTDDKPTGGFPMVEIPTEPSIYEVDIPTPGNGWPQQLDVLLLVCTPGQDKALTWQGYYHNADVERGYSSTGWGR